MTDSP